MYASNALRSAHRVELHREIEQVLLTHARSVWIEKFDKAGVPCGPINTIEELFDDLQAQHLGLAQSLPTATGNSIRYLGQPLRDPHES